jgi:non-heme chloroperoxidase
LRVPFSKLRASRTPAIIFVFTFVLVLLMHADVARAQSFEQFESFRLSVTTSDGVRLSVIDIGPQDASQTLVFLPGWTMPAAIFAPQVQHFSKQMRVLAIDPRGQGLSEIASSGYTVERRARDVYEVLGALKPAKPVLIAWSLGVLETLKVLDQHKDVQLAGVVLIDNSVGEATPPKSNPNFFPDLRAKRGKTVENFVKSMFKSSPSTDYLSWLTAQALRTNLEDSIRLLSYPVPREFWRETLYATKLPAAYWVSPRFAAQAEAVRRNRPATDVRDFPNAGHALFVDEPQKFNEALQAFISKLAT